MDDNSFSRVIYYWHGKIYVVDTPATLAQQPPGYSDNPAGPWPAGFDGQTPWEPGKGPFAPNAIGRQVPINGVWVWFPPRWVPHLVYATRSLIYAGWARSILELFFLERPREDTRLLAAGDIDYVPPYSQRDQRTRHEQTGRCFLDEEARDAYAQRYEAGDSSDFFPSLGEPGKDAGPAARSLVSERRHRGRPPGRGKWYPNPHHFAEILGKGVYRFRQDTGRDPTRQEAINYVTWPDHDPSIDILKDRLGELEMSYTDFLTTIPWP